MNGETSSAWIGVWRSGPDAGASVELHVGKHLVGRAHTARFRCDDPALQAHHALLEVTADDVVRLTQLTGRTAIRVDGEPLDKVGEVRAGASVELGASAFSLSRGRVESKPVHVHNGAVVRAPRSVSELHSREVAAPLVAPVREATTGGLLPALLGLAGAATIALILRQPMFLLFGALGALVAIGSWVAQHAAASRRFRAARAEFEVLSACYEADLRVARAEVRRHQLATIPTVEGSMRTILEQDASLWSRRAHHHDAFVVAIGMNATDPEVPISADIGPGCRLALLGGYGACVARALIVQLVASCGPADVRITVVTDHPERWSSLRALPHVSLSDGTAAIVGDSDVTRVVEELDAATHHVWLTDQPTLLATRTSPLRRSLGDPQRDALIVVVSEADDAAVPHVCRSVLTTTSGSIARWVSDVQRTLLPQHVRVVGVGERMLARCATALRGLIDPEDPMSVSGSMPRQLSLVNLMNELGCATTAPSIAAAWAAAPVDPPPRTVIGRAADGAVDIDLVRDGPHGLIAGTTGSGKSEFLRSLVVGMAAATSPTHLTFVLVDYKGGATFDACAALPHVVGIVTDLDDQLADRALRSLNAELRRREAVLREHGVADLTELRALAPSVTLPRLVVVIDEFAALVAEQPVFLHALVGVAQRGRSLGIHLLLATQRPSGVITDDIRANTNLRLALRVQDTLEAVDVVGIGTPAQFARGIPGRAILRLGADDYVTFQTAQCTLPVGGGVVDTELARLVRAIGDAAKLAKVPNPRTPCLPPLPALLTRDDLNDVVAIGLIDEPDLQRTRPLQWSLDEGHLAIVGSAGSGVTSALLTLADRTLSGTTGVDLYVIDARGDERWDQVVVHPGCVATVRSQESERLHRLVHRLSAQTCSRQLDSPRTLLIIDGLDALRRTLDDVHTAIEYDALERVLADASTAGITIVAGAESAAALPMSFLNRCPARWVLHLNDAHDAALLGLASGLVPARVPGRMAIAGSGTTSQLVVPGPISLVSTIAAVGDPISVVPARIQATELPESRAVGDVTSMCLGVEFNSGAPRFMDVPQGEHLLLIGGARSGRSTGLSRIVKAWSEAHPDSWVGAILPRRSTFRHDLARRVATTPTEVATLVDSLLGHHSSALLVVDDAELIDDANGRIAPLLTNGSVCVVAAGRPDALRQIYGHWTSAVRRSRLGLIATGGSELDGDLLSATLPRRLPVPPRPGLWWAVDNGSVGLVQLALDEHARSEVATIAM